MLIMLWLVKQIYLIDTCSVCANMVVICWLMTTTAEALMGIFSLTIVECGTHMRKFGMAIIAHCTHRCWLGPSRVSIAELDAYEGTSL